MENKVSEIHRIFLHHVPSQASLEIFVQMTWGGNFYNNGSNYELLNNKMKNIQFEKTNVLKI